MRWMAGWISTHGGAPNGEPVAGVRLRTGGASWIWTCAEPGVVRTTRLGERRLTTVGDCYAPEPDREKALADLDTLPSLAASWPGSFWTIVDDGHRHLVAGDLAGCRPLYTWATEGGVWWSSAQVPLAALAGTKADLAALAARVGVVDVESGTRSMFIGVERVPPGCALDVDGPTVRMRPYPAPDGSAAADAVGRLRDALSVSVGTRVNDAGRPTSDLSGGLDSSTLAALAAARTPILAITYSDPFSANSDLDHARAVAAALPDLMHREVVGDESCIDYAGVVDQPSTRVDAPAFALTLTGFLGALYRPAVDHGSDLHLSGEGGDAVLMGNRCQLTDLATAGHVNEAVRRTHTWAQAARLSPLGPIRAMLRLSRISYPQALAELATALPGMQVPASRASFAWCGPRRGLASLTGTGRQAVAAYVADTARHLPDDGLSQTPGRFHRWSSTRAVAGEQAVLTEIAWERWRLPLAFPFLDGPVVAACMAAPMEAVYSLTRYKPLLADAMAGLVPDALLARQTAGDFGGTGYRGVRRHHGWLADLIASSRLADAGLLSVPEAMQGLALTSAGIVSLSDLHIMAVDECWLRTLDLNRERWWTPRRDVS